MPSSKSRSVKERGQSAANGSDQEGWSDPYVPETYGNDSETEAPLPIKRPPEQGRHVRLPNEENLEEIDAEEEDAISRSQRHELRRQATDIKKFAILQELGAEKQKKDELDQELHEQVEAEEAGHGNRARDMNLAAKKATGFHESNLGPVRHAVFRLISWWGFDAVVGLVIICNGVTIGMQTHYKVGVPLGCTESCKCDRPEAVCELIPPWVETLEFIFLAVYIIELFLRIFVFGCGVFSSRWVQFDAFLVLSAIVDTTLTQVQLDQEVLAQIMLVRMARLARLARAVRLIVQFQTLWQLVQGLMHSVSTLLWTFVMVMVLIFIFAVLGMELIKADLDLPLDHPYNVIAIDHFRSLADAIMILIQAFSWDSISAVYRPLVKHRWGLVFYFAAVLLILAVALMNLVTAIMVEGSLAQGEEDKEIKKALAAVKKKKQMQHLKLMFLELDDDGSGELSMEEIDAAPPDVRDHLIEIAGTDDIATLFDMLDYDGGGTLGTDEFCEGVMKATNSDKPLELSRLVKQNSDILVNSRKVIALLRGEDCSGEEEANDKDVPRLLPQKQKRQKKRRKVDVLEARIGTMQRRMDDMQGDVKDLVALTTKLLSSKAIPSSMKKAVAICHGPVRTGTAIKASATYPAGFYATKDRDRADRDR
eukprot:TRINITY_DN3659_c0_g1_i1.p1 TRINITY_DN3659_c0_g1~~TRINITY_DN3659_c0_g1_i1.p1  ORF type:complete len:650 (-),score=131.16 TRINITY_DN3659_c0_g1_i1:99-2048(-)